MTSLALALLLSADAPLPPMVEPGAKPEVVYEAPYFFEGPTWHPAEGKLYFTAFGKDNDDTHILRLDEPGKVTRWAERTRGVNGTWRSKNGTMLGAQAFGQKVLRYTLGGDKAAEPAVVLDDKALNQPNDVCESPDGTVYFTDPDFKERKKSAVYLARAGKSVKIIDDMPLPNGLKVSPDGRTLYVGDSHLRHWKAYPIRDDGTVGEGKVFFDPDTSDRREPDGFALDAAGNLYLSGRGGCWVVSPAGKALGLIPIKEFCSNVTFGGPDGKTLYLTCDKKVYSVRTTATGHGAK